MLTHNDNDAVELSDETVTPHETNTDNPIDFPFPITRP